MNLPKPTRRDFAAAVVGAALLALAFALLGLGPWRYTVAAAASSQNSAVAAYVVDTWTGRARLWIYGNEQRMRTIAEQEDDAAARVLAMPPR